VIVSPVLKRLRSARPSAALIVALLALFVALGGPAQAARLLTGKDVKNRSLTTKDLSRKSIKSLRATPRGSVGSRALANGGVTSGKLADSAVTTGKIAPASIDVTRMAANAVGARELIGGSVGNAQLGDNSVTGAKIADGTLDSRDTTRFSGRFRVQPTNVGTIQAHKCWSGVPRSLAPELAGADISQDLVVASPDGSWPDSLAFTVHNAAITSDPLSRSWFVLAACNSTDTDVDWPEGGIGFRYAVIDLP
jgi:hypothetical protein